MLCCCSVSCPYLHFLPLDSSCTFHHTSATLCMYAIYHQVLFAGVRGRHCVLGGNVSVVVSD